jgi:hypothetical protein
MDTTQTEHETKPMTSSATTTEEIAELQKFFQYLKQHLNKKQPLVYVRALVTRDERFHAGLARRNTGVNYRTMDLATLKTYKTEGAAQERFRRAMHAIMSYNACQDELIKRWYINANIIHDLTGGRYRAIKAYVDSQNVDIHTHHIHFGITPANNRKPYHITTVIAVPPLPDPLTDGPGVFSESAAPVSDTIDELPDLL